MKKIDLHIHTVATIFDADFIFDMAKLSEYVSVMGLDGIAITNHNMFDRSQFDSISNTLDITVLPGIEVSLGSGPGHMLLISDRTNLDDFTAKCAKISDQIKTGNDAIDIAQLTRIFGDLSKYLLIPHYDKKPPLDQISLDALGTNFIVGEVSSAKKFIYALKNNELPTPLLMSDGRAKSDWEFKTRQTYIDIGTIDIRSIKIALADKTKLSLSDKDGSELIQVTPSGITISSGLTVILGGRSSGKSYTLDEISKYNDHVKYIKQFDLIEIDPEKEAQAFNDRVGKRQRQYGDSYLEKFKDVVNDVRNISIDKDERRVNEYLESLMKYAADTERQDAFSKAIIFSESELHIDYGEKLEKIIEATKTLLNPGKYSDILEPHLNRDDLIGLLHDLIIRYRSEATIIKKQEIANDLVASIKHRLGAMSAISPIKDVDLLEIARNKAKIVKFSSIVKEIQKPRTITTNVVGKFKIEQRSIPIKGAQDLKDISGKKLGFSDAFPHYNNPYGFLEALKSIDGVDPETYYKYYTKIEYNILNQYGVPVSGGERAEFRLINEIGTATSFDMLLIDEPESSFDNIFLSSDVNETIKNIAKNTPVVIVTHNNTVGASIKPNYLIYTERNIVEGSPIYKLYSGRATDRSLVSDSGDTISNSEVTLKYLEAGKNIYNERGQIYAMLEN
ncbi:phosphotransferase [Candidatus Roizmanbacteria bacterium]|nr:phosphotransferase [Candidatus Roizmanbacteria bacterium]